MSLKVDIFIILAAPSIHNTTQMTKSWWPLDVLSMTSKNFGLVAETPKKKNTGNPVMTAAWIFP